MKKIILLLIGCIFFAVSARAVYTVENTYEENGLVYDKETRQPITGKVLHYDGSNLQAEKPYINGKLEGLVKTYYENGNLESETPYKNGKREGVDKWYYKNGNLEREINYNQGKAVSGYLYDWEGNRTKMTNAHLHNLHKEINSFQ